MHLDFLLNCFTPLPQGHRNWVLVVAWSPDGKFVVSGDMDGQIMVWDPVSGKALGTCNGHKKWITAIVSDVVAFIIRVYDTLDVFSVIVLAGL